jgi:hypothetical protein
VPSHPRQPLGYINTFSFLIKYFMIYNVTALEAKDISTLSTSDGCSGVNDGTKLKVRNQASLKSIIFTTV